MKFFIQTMAFALALTCAVRAQPSITPSSPQPPSVEDYGRLPSMEKVTISPTGVRYAFVAHINGTRQLVMGNLHNKDLQHIEIGTAKLHSLIWAGDDHLIVLTSSTVRLGAEFGKSKSELYSASSINLVTNKAIVVFGHVNSRVAETVLGLYGTAQIDGRWYGYFGGFSMRKSQLVTDDEGRLARDLYQVDLDTGDFQLKAYGALNQTGWLIGPDGAVAARSFHEDDSGKWSLSAETPRRQLLAGRDPIDEPSIVGFGKTRDSILVSVPGPGDSTLLDAPLAGGAAQPALGGETIAGTLIDPITRLWIGVEEQNDTRSAKLFDVAAQNRLNSLDRAFPGLILHLESYSSDFNHIIVKTEGGDDSGTYWFVDFTSGRGRAIGLGLSYPSIGPESVGPVKVIDYKAADGFALRGVLTLPPGGKASNLPIVIMPHGGPVARDYPGFDYWAQAFAARGYAVFQPNFRGSGGYGAGVRDAGYGQWGRKMQTDVSDGLAELVREGVADPKRACIVGASYGGYVALAGVTVQRGLYRCAVSLAGIADLENFLEWKNDQAGYDTSTTRFWRKFMGATGAWSDSQVRDISPIRLVSRADAPILLIHGDNDTVVPIEQSKAMKRALNAAGKSVAFITLPKADHWLLEEDARVAVLKASVAFVLKYDPPDPAPLDVAAQ